MDQFWLIVKAMWQVEKIINDQMKKETLVTTLWDQTLTWYIKYSTDNLTTTLVDIQTALNKKFNRPMSEAESIVEFKEIMMKLGETHWELD